MEALGFVASLATVIQLAAQVTQLSYSYVREVKNAPKIQKQYLQEVSALMDALFRVDQVIIETESTGLLPPRPTALDDEALMNCYKELSNLHYELQKRKSRLLRPFQDKELRPHIEMLHRFRQIFSDYLSACTLATTNATYQKVSSMNIEQDRAMLLTLVPPAEIQLRQKPTPCPGTGTWFLNNSTVRDWIERSSRLLWCHGPPGVGKSFLASIVIDDLAKQNTSGALVAYFFCDFSAQSDHTTINILRSMIRQVVERGGKDVLRVLKESLGSSHAPQSAADITQMIAQAGTVQPIYLVLDAVDEMKDSNELLSCCLNLTASGIQVLITSRKLPFIQKKMTTASQLEITGSPEDLKLYIERRLKDSDFEDELLENDAMIDDIMSRSGNLFLLTRLTLDELLDLTTVSQIRKALKKEAVGLQQMFQSTLQRIDSQSKARSLLARRLISWILYAKRRLRMQEILTAFAIDEEGLDYDNMPAPDILLRICVGLVVVNQADKTLGLVHTSAYEYFYTLLSSEGSHFDIAQTCLRYLGLKGLMSEPCNSSEELMTRLDELQFLSYSAKHWGHHIRNQDLEKKLQPLIIALLDDDQLRNNAFRALQFRREFEGSLADEIFDSLPKGQHALHAAAYWNLVGTVEIILKAGADVCAADSHKWTALHWACANNHLLVARLLVQRGANVNLPDMQGWTPLFWAAFVGNVELVRLLLSNGANHQLRSDLGWTALHWAISGGHFSVAKELLDHHSRSMKAAPRLYTMTLAQIKAYSQNAVSPIEFAADTQDADLFNLLAKDLETRNGRLGDPKFNYIWENARFDVPVSRNPWRTLTKGERVNGTESTVPTLSNHSEDDRAENSLRWKSVLLASAIRDEQFASTQMLVKAGADPNSVCALHIAAHRRDPRYVQYLLQNGADASLTDDRGRSALHIAVLNGFVETMTALIHGGSDVNQPMSDYEQRYRVRNIPPLVLACDNLHMVRILLSNGADPNLRDSSGKTPLHHAFSRGDLPLIKLLIGITSPADIMGPNGETPLHYLTGCNEDALEMDELNEMALFLISTGKMLSPPKEFLNEATTSPSFWTRPSEPDESHTPLSLALSRRRWKLVHVFSKLGAPFPSGLNMSSLIEKATEALKVDTISLLCSEGGRPSADAVLLLVKSYVREHRFSDVDKTILCVKFKESLRLLCSAGADINYSETIDSILTTKGKKGTPLILATRLRGSRHIVQDLLSHGADLYCQSDETFDPILTAALLGEQEDISLLLSHSAAHPSPSHWTRFLKEAPDGDPIERVCFCLKKAGCLDKTNTEGQTLLHLATLARNSTLISALMAEGARRRGNSPIASAPNETIPGNDSLRAALEDAGALGIAVQNHDISMVSKLLQGGSDPNQTITEWGHGSPVLYYAARHGQREIVSLLLSHGADIEATESHGWRPLHVACFKGYTDIAGALIAKGADVHASTLKWNNDREKPSGLYEGDAWTGTPLHAATMGGHPDIVKLLLEHNVDVLASTGVTDKHCAYPASGPTALHIALSVSRSYGFIAGKLLSRERLQIAQWLVDAGAMVQGVIQEYSLGNILYFEEFPELWDSLVAGNAESME